MKKQSATLSTLCRMYLKVNRRIEESTADLTRRAFDHLIKAVGDIEVNQLTFADVEQFQAGLIDKGLRRTSANIFVKTIKPVFNWAVGELIETSPFEKLKLFKIARKKVEVFTPHEVERLLRACPDQRWKAIVMLGLTSMRKGEVLNLTVRDIDFKQNVVFVEPKDETAYTWRWQPKDYERRMLPLIPQLSKVLTRLYEKLPSGQPYLLLKPERYSYLLMSKGKMTDRVRKCPDNNFNRTFKSICKRAFINGCFHMLRKTSLTELSSGLRLQEVQELAGHSSIETTRFYLANRPDLLTRAGDIIERGVAQFG